MAPLGCCVGTVASCTVSLPWLCQMSSPLTWPFRRRYSATRTSGSCTPSRSALPNPVWSKPRPATRSTPRKGSKPFYQLTPSSCLDSAHSTDPPPAVSEALRNAAANGARVVSVCTGAFALAAAGLLDGKRATTHWKNAERLQTLHPAVAVDAGVLYIDEGDVSTSAGVAAGIDLCLHLVRTDHGAEAANRIARRMVVAPHREGGQAQFIERPVAAPLAHFAETCGWAIQHLAEPLTVVDMAVHAGWAPSSFARKFLAEAGTTPLRWLTSQRIAQACRLLETTDLTVQAVAARTGLGTSANFRLHFTRVLNTTPSNYRRLYQGRNRSAIAPRSPEGGFQAQSR